jgi:chloride channel 3/4/5
VGYVTRDKLTMSIESLFSQEPALSPTRRCTFSSWRSTTEDDLEDLSDVVEEAVLQLRKEQPQELVVDMFQKLVSAAASLWNVELSVGSNRTSDRFCSRTKEN